MGRCLDREFHIFGPSWAHTSFKKISSNHVFVKTGPERNVCKCKTYARPSASAFLALIFVSVAQVLLPVRCGSIFWILHIWQLLCSMDFEKLKSHVPFWSRYIISALHRRCQKPILLRQGGLLPEEYDRVKSSLEAAALRMCFGFFHLTYLEL